MLTKVMSDSRVIFELKAGNRMQVKLVTLTLYDCFLQNKVKYCKAKKENKELIELIHIEDKQFAAIAPFAQVGDSILPSGFKVPEGDWKIVRTYLIKNFSQPE